MRNLCLLLATSILAGCSSSAEAPETTSSAILEGAQQSLLVSVSSAFGSAPSVQFLGQATVRTDESGTGRVMDLSLTALRAADRTPTATIVTANAVPVTPAGEFTADFGRFTLPAEALGMGLGAATLDLRLNGNIFTRCGETRGRVLSPPVSLDGFTWGAVAWTPGTPTPPPVVSCPPSPPAPAAYLLAIALPEPSQPLRFFADATLSQNGAGIDLRLQPLRANSGTPVGQALTASAPLSSTADFDADFGDLVLPSEMFSIPLGPARVHLHLVGNAVRRCGETSGTTVEGPLPGPFHSTWGTVALPAPFSGTLPAPVTRCAP